MPSLSLDTPVGTITIVQKDEAITQLTWEAAFKQTETDLLLEARRQIQSYFKGELKAFDLPLSPRGGDFHQSVFKAMSAIPYGQTRTYGEIAAQLSTYGQPVGQACGANPIAIIIPCHRVLSAEGLGGYSGSGGLETKILLLQLEGGYPFLV
ncbi:methylated-DNA--[protein]-cysteine S-methyltransferase [Roseibium sp.]|uniref:methylated-DNA--[protein]-cysteine S-methyltransferase n=1 Tax=Roseibium sp. TaxID=1936156 RepID=UPI003A980DC2